MNMDTVAARRCEAVALIERDSALVERPRLQQQRVIADGRGICFELPQNGSSYATCVRPAVDSLDLRNAVIEASKCTTSERDALRRSRDEEPASCSTDIFE